VSGEKEPPNITKQGGDTDAQIRAILLQTFVHCCKTWSLAMVAGRKRTTMTVRGDGVSTLCDCTLCTPKPAASSIPRTMPAANAPTLSVSRPRTKDEEKPATNQNQSTFRKGHELTGKMVIQKRLRIILLVTRRLARYRRANTLEGTRGTSRGCRRDDRTRPCSRIDKKKTRNYF
jgi:hypothetical protein